MAALTRVFGHRRLFRRHAVDDRVRSRRKPIAQLSKRVAVGTLAALTLSTLPVVAAPPVHALGGTIKFTGHGFGHGRGLSQFGAYGYARAPFSWSAGQILDHYYGGTSMQNVGNLGMSVRLLGNDGKDMIVTSDTGFSVGGINFAGGEAARVRRVGGNSFQIDGGGGCSGPWSLRGSASGPVNAFPANSNQPANNPNIHEFIVNCASDGAKYTYRGYLKAIDDNGTIRTVNEVMSEDYLLGVVPRESPASWGDNGGMEALKAQAVAARSYVLAGGVYSYATTCDSTACQVYGGVAKNGTVWENGNTNAAVAATAGLVRKLGNGLTARTEFSSSSGGYTAGGTFPAVVDEGDAAPNIGNSNHTWSADIPVTTIQSAYPSIGTLTDIQFNQRNNLGEWGGRVLSMTLVGTNGSVTTSGYSFRGAVGNSVMKSDWFTISHQPSGGNSGYWLMASDGGIFSMGDAQFYGSMGGKPLNAPVVGLTPTPTTRGYWLVASDGGIFNYGDAEFKGSMGGHRLNAPVVAMVPTPSGHGYWMVASDGGVFNFGDAGFFGSMGGHRLNAPVVGIAATPSGNGYWLVASDGGIFNFGDAGFMGSMGGQRLAKPVVGMAKTSGGNGYWLVAADGGLFSFGTTQFYGSLAGSGINDPATGMAVTANGNGYFIVTAGGRVFTYGDAPDYGSMSDIGVSFRRPVTGIAPWKQ